ncbi:uncharacterized protein LOC125654468 isoform X2 [Ostrea edulis]|uniref:uncharacterized protein LOC125654468 isoform X2 n=1 Tax=Ostrea edulis TaxID=37623 RepID=UPI002095CD50|nr:uncharacterized protein LOC125654468 isoform X2 [Ostrea edulis]
MTDTTLTFINQSTVGTSTEPTTNQWDIWKQIMDFLAAHHDIFIKTGIGMGGFLFGIILMWIVFKCKERKKTEVSRTKNNGVPNNGRTSTEMDTLLRQYISDTKTMNQQWQEATSGTYNPEQQMSSTVDDAMPMSQIHGAQCNHDASCPTIDVPAFEYTNSALAQEYMATDTHGVEESTVKSENYFLLEKNFIETNEHPNGSAIGGSDNYFLLDKEYIGAESQDQVHISML